MYECFLESVLYCNFKKVVLRYNSVRPLATLAYTTDMFNNSSIVSSIEFDKNQEFFAIAGVTKRIKIYDYNVVLKVGREFQRGRNLRSDHVKF